MRCGASKSRGGPGPGQHRDEKCVITDQAIVTVTDCPAEDSPAPSRAVRPGPGGPAEPQRGARFRAGPDGPGPEGPTDICIERSAGVSLFGRSFFCGGHIRGFAPHNIYSGSVCPRRFAAAPLLPLCDHRGTKATVTAKASHRIDAAAEPASPIDTPRQRKAQPRQRRHPFSS